MISTKVQAMSALRKHATWVKNRAWEQAQREPVQYRAVNVTVGCFRILRGCGTDVCSWIDRRPGRKALRKPMTAVRLRIGP